MHQNTVPVICEGDKTRFARSPTISSLIPRFPRPTTATTNCGSFLTFKMQFAPPTKESDVTIGVVDGGEQGVDQNGLVVGRWKTGIFGFTDSLVPNGITSCCCPGLAVAQIAARLGMMNFYHVLGCFGALYLWAIIAAATHSGFVDFVMVVAAIVASLCCMRMRWRIRTLFSIPGSHAEDAFYSMCCGCCSIAQMASHVESYEPGSFTFAPRSTLQGYSFN